MFTSSNTVQTTPRISAEDFDAAAREASLSHQTDLLQGIVEPAPAKNLHTESRLERQCRFILPYVLVAWGAVWTGAALALYTSLDGGLIIAGGAVATIVGAALLMNRKTT